MLEGWLEKSACVLNKYRSRNSLDLIKDDVL